MWISHQTLGRRWLYKINRTGSPRERIAGRKASAFRVNWFSLSFQLISHIKFRLNDRTANTHTHTHSVFSSLSVCCTFSNVPLWLTPESASHPIRSLCAVRGPHLTSSQIYFKKQLAVGCILPAEGQGSQTQSLQRIMGRIPSDVCVGVYWSVLKNHKCWYWRFWYFCISWFNYICPYILIKEINKHGKWVIHQRLLLVHMCASVFSYLCSSCWRGAAPGSPHLLELHSDLSKRFYNHSDKNVLGTQVKEITKS